MAIFSIFLLGSFTGYTTVGEYALTSVSTSDEKTRSILWRQWFQRQNYRKALFGDASNTPPFSIGQFYFFDPELIKRVGVIDKELISHNGGSIYFWKTKSGSLSIKDWTIMPDDLHMPLGLVKVRWVNENDSYDKFLTILTENFACSPLQESHTCFKVDLMTDTPRKFVERKYFDRLITWDITSIQNGRYRLVLRWKTGQLISPVFNIQHSTSANR